MKAAETIVGRLVAAGMSQAEAATKDLLFARAVAALWAVVGRAARLRMIYVPGRIEFLGKHTDYAGGRSLVCPVERGFCVVVTPRGDSSVGILDVAGERQIGFEIASDLAPAAGDWSNYPMTVARRLARNFPGKLRGADIAFASDLPPAAGMSSSSAMVVAMYLALAEANHLERRAEYRASIRSREDLAGYLGTIENGQSFGTLVGDKGVGTFGGSEDHTAILCGRPGQLSQYSYCPVRFERSIALPKDYVFVIGVSGVVAEKTGAAREAYNRASGSASAALDLWRKSTGRSDLTLAAALASGSDALARLKEICQAGTSQFSGQVLANRIEQFHRESEQIVPAVGDLLAAGRVKEIGDLVVQSQSMAERMLGNQVPETVFLARSAREAGALAASAFGAGFGGSVWALVKANSAQQFMDEWSSRYRHQFPARAAASQFLITRPGPAALEL